MLPVEAAGVLPRPLKRLPPLGFGASAGLLKPLNKLPPAAGCDGAGAVEAGGAGVVDCEAAGVLDAV